MPNAIVTLAEKSRYPKPSVGPFIWSNVHNRHVFKDTEAKNMEELGKLVEEAFDYIRTQNSPFLTMRVVMVESSQPETDPSETNFPKKKLKLKTHENAS